MILFIIYTIEYLSYRRVNHLFQDKFKIKF